MNYIKKDGIAFIEETFSLMNQESVKRYIISYNSRMSNPIYKTKKVVLKHHFTECC